MQRASRAVWAKRVERWGDSGLSAKQFAAEIGVSQQSLTFWRWKLRRDASVHARGETSAPVKPRAGTRSTTTFLQLLPTLTTQSKPSNLLELVLSNGLAIRIPPEFDEPTLKRLVALLGGA
jgi:transposase-like protein